MELDPVPVPGVAINITRCSDASLFSSLHVAFPLDDVLQREMNSRFSKELAKRIALHEERRNTASQEVEGERKREKEALDEVKRPGTCRNDPEVFLCIPREYF